MWSRVACLLLGVGLGAQGCELQSCTEAGCISGVVITASSAGPLPDGEYEVALLLDGEAHSCTGTHPRISEQTVRCEPDAHGVTLYLSERGPVVVPPGTMPSGLYIEIIDRTPRSIQLEITHDGKLVAAESFTPEYTEFAPNGEECGPVCRSAELEAPPLMFE